MSLASYDPPVINLFHQADPAAHVWKCDPKTVWVYGSHDWNSTVLADDVGGKYDMKDYWVLSHQDPESPANVVAKLLDLQDVQWSSKQLWAPDATEKDGKYYLFYPAKDKSEYQLFRIGVAISDTPDGHFTPEANYIEGSYSIDPAILADDDNSYHIYFGGLWGGQLQAWTNNVFDASQLGPNAPENGTALSPRYARLSGDLKSFVEPPQDVILIDQDGRQMQADSPRRFFEGPSINKINGLYYFSYSTGTTHTIEVAVSDKREGPFTWNSTLLQPVEGWTTHSSIVKHEGRYWLYYADASVSKQDNLRNTKARELVYQDGTLSLKQPQPVLPSEGPAKRSISRRHAMEFTS